MQLLQKKELCPTFDFELNGENEGEIEYLVSSLMKKRNDYLQDRRLWKKEEIEETKNQLEIQLKNLIHRVVEKLDIPTNVEALVMKGLNLDLQKIINDKTLPNFNKQLFIKDATKELKENHLDILEKEFQGPLKHFVSPKLELVLSKNALLLYDEIFKIKWEEDQLFEDNSIKDCQLNDFLKLNNKEFFLMKASNEMGKSALSK